MLSINDLIQDGAISAYRNGNKEPLLKLLASNDELRPNTRDFLAKIITGDAKVKAHRPKKNIHRDIVIYEDINYLINNEGYNLTSNSMGQGAAAEVAEWRGMSEDAVIKIYNREKKKYGQK
jgi:hypothetical protein